MKKLQILKIGGNVIDNEVLLDQFLFDFNKISCPKIVIHGGGKIATNFAEKLNIPQKMLNGRRVTDKETLQLVTMVYAGLINKKIVSKLQKTQCDAIGFSGADGNVITSERRTNSETDFGFVGDVKEGGVNGKRICQFLEMNLTPVFNAITHDGKGELLNTNADTIACKIALEMAHYYDVQLTYCFEKKGVLTDVDDDTSCLKTIDQKEYEGLKAAKIISEGMIPKLDNAFEALKNGVTTVKICHAADFNACGTLLI